MTSRDRRDILPTDWRATVKRLIKHRLDPPDIPKPMAFAHAVRTDPKRFLGPDISGLRDAQRYNEARCWILTEAEKILGSEEAKKAARKLVRACLEAKSGIAAAGDRTPEDRTGLALAALSEEICFIAEKIVLHPGSPRQRFRKVEAMRVANAFLLARSEAPSGFAQDPDWVQETIDYFDPSRHGEPGPHLLLSTTIINNLTEANLRLCGHKVYGSTGLLLAVSSSEDVSWKEKAPLEQVRAVRDRYEHSLADDDLRIFMEQQRQEHVKRFEHHGDDKPATPEKRNPRQPTRKKASRS